MSALDCKCQPYKELLPELSNARVLCKDGFHQVSPDEGSCKLTTFCTPFERYHLTQNAVSSQFSARTFQSKLHECLADLHGVKVIRDDILVIGYGETDEKPLMDHDHNVIRLLERLLKAREPEAQLLERQAEANRGQVYGPCKGSGIPTSLLPPRTCPNLHLNLNNPRWLAKNRET